MQRPSCRRLRLGRLLGLAVVCAIAVAYVQPMRAYFDARGDVHERQSERAGLVREQTALRARLLQTDTDAFIEREARRLGLVRPGEWLFIVGGLKENEGSRLR